MANADHIWDVVIVGAGPAGLGAARALGHFGLDNYTILERHEVGASFMKWPAEMRLITPSFNSNQFGFLDMNSFGLRISPAQHIGFEHPSGVQYAAFLRAFAKFLEIPVQQGIEVNSVAKNGEIFELDTSEGVVKATFVIWAAGEFQYPRLAGFPGAEHCLHNSLVKSWRELDGEDFIIVGGYESGMDAAIHLAVLGKNVTVMDGTAPWFDESQDPSVSLSPFTQERLLTALKTKRIKLSTSHVTEVEKTGSTYTVKTSVGSSHETDHPPILATGFNSSLVLVKDHFSWKNDKPELTEQDESTVTPGFFLVGPQVWHDQVIFCFIYKFRQRFAIIANAIAKQFGLDTKEAVDLYRDNGMFLDDLSCCKESCHSC